MDTKKDSRRKLSHVSLFEIRSMLKEGHKPEAIARTFCISNTHIYRIQQAYRNGEVNLKRTSLHNILHMVSDGLPFRRVAWPEGIYYYYAIDEPRPWFVQVNMETGNELITYSLDLNLEDLKAKDWVALTWESVNDHVVDANKKVME